MDGLERGGDPIQIQAVGSSAVPNERPPMAHHRHHPAEVENPLAEFQPPAM